MTSLRAVRSALVGAASVAAILVPGAAFAGTSSFADPVETANAEDITSVRVNHFQRYVLIRVTQQTMRPSGTDLPLHATIAISTGPRFDGPEFLIEQPFYTEGGPNLRRTQGWDGPKGPLMDDCFAVPSWEESADQIAFTVPRRCIGRPERVRVNVVYRFFEPVGARKRDFAPAARTLGPAAAH